MTADDQELDSRIRDVLAHVLEVPATQIGDESRFAEDFGGDSMTTLEILSELERHFAITIPEEYLPRMVHLAGVRGVLLENLSAPRTGG
jgi:acyl carrier protein